MQVLLTCPIEPMGTLIRRLFPQVQLLHFPGLEALITWLDVSNGSFDAAFLHLETEDDLRWLRALRERRPRSNFILVSESPRYMSEGFLLHASGYLLSPVTAEAVRRELEDLRYPPRDPRLQVQTFGNFEVFSNGLPVHFRRSRTKELFAYLVDRRGAGSTTGELISVLWEGRPDTVSLRSQLRSLISDLRTTLGSPEEEAPIIRRRGFIAVDPNRLDCDYYRFLAGDPTAINAFQGEYMANYSWAETTVGTLQSLRRTTGRRGKR